MKRGMYLSSRQRGGSKPRTTLNDVANIAGVSPITVSRALREPQKVSDKLREQILSIVDDIGYVPNFAARSLASRHSGVVAVLGPILGSRAFSLAAKGVEDRFQRSDLRTQFANTGLNAAEEAQQLKLFLAQNPAGIIIESFAEFPVNKKLIAEIDCPVVQMMDTSLDPLDMGVGICHRDAAAAATRMLISKGYRRIASLGASKDIRSRRRFDGYRDALVDAGLYDPALVIDSEREHSLEFGMELLDRIHAEQPDVDAAFCHSDELALGVYFRSLQLGLRVPEDFGICGYDGMGFAGMKNAPLTTVQVPLYEIGEKAAELIIRFMSEGERPNDAVRLDATIIEGRTTRS
ncbi:LacI family transcriptional regulator [Martelella alba]|uniref:LacI family transcriptional regulator n=2 Tax=Martelella alba TaxID=2590451 RepID=A0A506UCM6_9HYPH|nr:LacI family transcriptional regulator [Martelella alba]